MQAGSEIRCPHCGKDSFLVKKSIMDGWKKTGEILACSSCTATIHQCEPETGNSKGDHIKKEKSKLLGLLGAEEVKKITIESSDDERRFCKDCRNFISHPFLSRCGLHSKSVEPMEDCPDFKRS